MTLTTSNGSRTLLLTFDAFSTVFHPRPAVPEQYASTAHSFGLSPSVVTPSKIKTAFKETYKAQSKRWPNYGRQEVLNGRYGGPRQWWGEVIKGSFTRVIRGDGHSLGGVHNNEEEVQLPDGLVESLLDRFASKEGYALYPDVEPFFERLRALRNTSGNDKHGLFSRTVVGVISNSDDRVPAVLKSLGLKVGNVRADQGRSSMELPGFEEGVEGSSSDSSQYNDIDMIITSYEAGEEKPHPLIFQVAKRQASSFLGVSAEATNTDDWTCVHVGDNYEQDYKGALNAGWKSFLLLRDNNEGPDDAAKISTLEELLPKLEAYAVDRD
ncbi:hypothetical protein DTO027B5_7093 [Paecilomyces variotii]|nr:hypothetical protein DTO169C6_5910 [Paecilomyces variotii]KAJ9285255.1 hypothetical protein DTO021C3_7173 [Paecilomyces variotii]KAJ9321482.1 hypothetical protein DTO027B3_7515 [Paecilomyces variotii]KAJ9331130.1 hypothetical protein DTO027B5_7093 [Paecilomyces variotii]